VSEEDLERDEAAPDAPSGGPRVRRLRREHRAWADRLVRVLLRFVGLLRRPLEALGVDHRQLEAIVETKLRLDLRRSAKDASGAATVQSARGTGLLVSCVVHLFMGLFVGLMTLAIGDPLAFMTVTQGFLLLMLGVTVLADFGHVVLDTKDLSVVGSRPVTERTLFAARIVHVALYLGLTTGSLAVVPLLFGLPKFGAVFLPVYVVSSLLTACVAVFGAGVLYLAALRRVGGEKLRDFVVHFQILASAGLVTAFQLMPELTENAAGRLGVDGDAVPFFAYFFPPSHTGGLLDLCLGHATRANAVLSALAFALPALFAGVMVRLSSSGLVGGLSALDTESARRPPPGRWRRWCRDRFTGSRVEACGFDFFALLAGRERQYKLQTYPMVAVVLALAVVSAFRAPGHALVAVSAIYYVSWCIPSAILNARYSETPGAAWSFEALPFGDPGVFLLGARKAFLACWAVPLLAVVALFGLIVAGPAALPHVLFAGLASLAVQFRRLRATDVWTRDGLLRRAARGPAAS